MSSRENKNRKDEKSRTGANKFNAVLDKWQKRYQKAKSKYDGQLQKFKAEVLEYDGSDKIFPVSGGSQSTKKALVARNVVYELIESEIDSTIPQPRITALHEEDAELAQAIEAMLQNWLEQLPMEAVNDSNERETYLHGGSFVHIDWDALGGLHETLGSVEVKDLATNQVIPQEGQEWIADCDWYFIVQNMARERVKREYKKDVSSESNDEPEAGERADNPINTEDSVTVITAFYKNDHDGIGKFSWCGDTVLEDTQDYLRKQQRICSECGAVVTGETCAACGSENWKYKAVDEIPLPRNIVIRQSMPDGSVAEEQLDAMSFDGIEQQLTMVPVYHMKHYPTVMRKNISAKGRFMGVSDVQAVLPLQEAMKKLDTKILEKLLKGGSYVTLPEGVKVDTTDAELKILRLKTADQKSMIQPINMQPNINNDITLRQSYYDDMKSCLGISDSYQGKYDSSATSGTAKQISVNQAAGRLESKRVMKQQMWGEMYRVMFEMWLLFSDDLTCVRKDEGSGSSFKQISKWDFLRRDVSGKLYWNDEFLFGVDVASVSPADRAAMQQQIRNDFTAGMFGPTESVESRIRMWKMMVKYHAPGAKEMLDMALQEQQEQLQAQQQQQLDAQQAAEFAAKQAAAEQAQAEAEGAVPKEAMMMGV